MRVTRGLWLGLILACWVGIESFMIRHRIQMSGQAIPIPGPPALPLLGNLLGVVRHGGLERYQQKLAERYGSSLVRLKLLGDTFVLVNDPEITKEIFTKQVRCFDRKYLPPIIGELIETKAIVWELGGSKTWATARKAASPPFTTTAALDSYVPVLIEVSSELSAILGAAMRQDQAVPVRLNEALSKAALDILGRVSLSVRLGMVAGWGEKHGAAAAVTGAGAQGEDIPGLGALAERQPGAIWDAAFFPLPIHKLGLSPPFRRARRVMREMDALMRNHMKTRVNDRARQQGQPMDLLQTLLDQGVDEEATLAILRDVFFAGSDTTSSIISLTLHAVVTRPALYSRVMEELKAVSSMFSVANDTVRPSAATLQDHVPLLMACVRETLRLHPTGSFLNRRATVDTVLGGADGGPGYVVPVDSVMIISPYFFHRSTSIWGTDALEYKPERFSEGGAERDVSWEQASGSFLPFGGGLFKCMGYRLAMLQAVVVCATLLLELGDHMEFVDGSEGPKMTYAPFLQFPEGVRVRYRG